MDNRYPNTNSKDQSHQPPTPTSLPSPDKSHGQPTYLFTPTMIHPPPFHDGHPTHFPRAHHPSPDVSYPHHTRHDPYESCWTSTMPFSTTAFWDDREGDESQQAGPNEGLRGSKRGREGPEDDEGEVKKRAIDVETIEDQLSYLTDEWQIISIVLHSVRNAYLTGKTSEREDMPLETIMDVSRGSGENQEEVSSEILKEIKIAFDELGIQVKQLAKKIDMLEDEKNKLINKLRSIEAAEEASSKSPSDPPGQLGSSRSNKSRRPIKVSGQSTTSRKGKEKAT